MRLLMDNDLERAILGKQINYDLLAQFVNKHCSKYYLNSEDLIEIHSTIRYKITKAFLSNKIDLSKSYVGYLNRSVNNTVKTLLAKKSRKPQHLPLEKAYGVLDKNVNSDPYKQFLKQDFLDLCEKTFKTEEEKAILNYFLGLKTLDTLSSDLDLSLNQTRSRVERTKEDLRNNEIFKTAIFSVTS